MAAYCVQLGDYSALSLDDEEHRAALGLLARDNLRDLGQLDKSILVRAFPDAIVNPQYPVIGYRDFVGHYWNSDIMFYNTPGVQASIGLLSVYRRGGTITHESLAAEFEKAGPNADPLWIALCYQEEKAAAAQDFVGARLSEVDFLYSKLAVSLDKRADAPVSITLRGDKFGADARRYVLMEPEIFDPILEKARHDVGGADNLLQRTFG